MGCSPPEQPAAPRASDATASRQATRDRSARIGGHPHTARANRDLAWPPAYIDLVDDLGAGRVDARDGAVDRVRYPDRAGSRGDAARPAACWNRRADGVGRWIYLQHAV